MAWCSAQRRPRPHPVPAGEDNLYVTLSPHWGSVTLDNRMLTRLPVEGVDQPIHLARGVHDVALAIRPDHGLFLPLTVPTKWATTARYECRHCAGKKGIAASSALQLR